jgi:hypothetical protein
MKATSDRLLPSLSLYIGERTRVVYLTPGEPALKEWLDKI